jgi:hypothetical protein
MLVVWGFIEFARRESSARLRLKTTGTGFVCPRLRRVRLFDFEECSCEEI